MKQKTAQAHGPHRASARSAARLVAAPLVALVLIIASGTAYAEVDWEVKSVDSGYKARIAPYPHTDKGRMGAVAEFLGFDWDSLSTTTQQKILADESGAVTLIRDERIKNLAYEYFEGEGTGVIGEFLETAGNAVVAFWTKTFGSDQVWMAECSYDEYGDARAVFLKYAYANDGTTGDEGGGSGGGSGGGGGVDSDETYVYFDTIPNDQDRPDDMAVTTSGLAIRLADYDKIVEFANANEEYKLWIALGVNANRQPYVQNSYTLSLMDKEPDYFKNYSSTVWGAWTWPGSFKRHVYSSRSAGSFIEHDGKSYLIANGSWNFSEQNINTSVYDAIRPTFSYYWGDVDGSGSGGSGGGGVENDPYVPSPDPTPQPPTLPTPPSTGSTIINNYDYTDHNYDVDIDWPDIDINLDWDGVIEDPYQRPTPTPVDPNGDELHILRQILAAINSFRSEVWEYYKKLEELMVIIQNTIPDVNNRIGMSLSQLLESLDDDIVEAIGELNSSIGSKIENRISWLNQNVGDNITQASKDIRDEIYKDAKYIVDSLNFNADFDDTDIVLWLKRIYARVKDRKVSVPAPDEDPQGWADAIAEFLEKILAMMVTGLDVAQISQLFDDLKNRFPISIPWDMVALLYLFDGEPVTPEFDWPMYNGDTKVTDLHCDFSDFDDAMGYVRQGELLLFAIGLMYNTKWLMNVESEVVRSKG